MTISVLATRCRFCGEEVGKPKDESRALTVEDLGGETIAHHAPSENVLSALEMYRADESSDEEGSRDLTINLPSLDERGQDLSAGPSASTIRTAPPPDREPTAKQRATRFVMIAVAIPLLLFGGIKATGWALGYIEARNQKPEFHPENTALEMLARGATPLEALAEAAHILALDPLDSNRKIAEEILEAVIEQFYSRLDAHPWSMTAITEATVIADKAASVYTTPVTRKLKAEASEENKAYRMMLKKVDSKTGKATFGLLEPAGAEITVEKQDTIAGRFIVKSIGRNSVKVEDTLRRDKQGKYRIVTYDVSDLPH